MRRGRPLVLLAGVVALLLQLLLGAHHHAGAAPATGTLAELAALTGQHDVFCAGAGDDRSGAPAGHEADDGGLCCQLGHQVAALVATPPAVAIRLARPTEQRLPQAAAPPSTRPALVAQPRGPPASA